MSATAPPTLAELKAYIASEGGKLTHRVIWLMAVADVERERVDSYIEPILQRYKFVNTYSGEPITRTADLYLVGDAPGVEASVAKFYEECDVAHRERGFKGPPGHCPALIAKTNLSKAENALIKSAGKVLIGVDDIHLYGDNRKKLLDILIDAYAQTRRDIGAATSTDPEDPEAFARNWEAELEVKS